MLLVLDIMQVTFITEPIVDLPTTSFSSQGMGTQTKMSNAPKHMINKFQLQRYLGNKWEGPRTLLGLRGKAIHA